MMIILGPNKVDEIQTKHNSEVKDAITKLLQYDLGLEVLPDGPLIIEIKKKAYLERSIDSDTNLEETLPIDLKSSTRRPAILRRLKVTKKSLCRWLQRRVGAPKR